MRRTATLLAASALLTAGVFVVGCNNEPTPTLDPVLVSFGPFDFTRTVTEYAERACGDEVPAVPEYGETTWGERQARLSRKLHVLNYLVPPPEVLVWHWAGTVRLKLYLKDIDTRAPDPDSLAEFDFSDASIAFHSATGELFYSAVETLDNDAIRILQEHGCLPDPIPTRPPSPPSEEPDHTPTPPRRTPIP